MTYLLRGALFALILAGSTTIADANSCPRHLRCGCWLATHLGITGHLWRELWVARNWAEQGRQAHRGCIDCIAVFRRGRHGGHVGQVKRWDANGNPVILSDLGSGTVTTQPHPVERLIALRWVR